MKHEACSIKCVRVRPRTRKLKVGQVGLFKDLQYSSGSDSIFCSFVRNTCDISVDGDGDW
jgi:hypothetical protein